LNETLEPVPQVTDAAAAECAECADCSCGCDLKGRSNLDSYNWLEGYPDDSDEDVVEVLFKNTRRGFFRNTSHLSLKQGDWVVVEANPGHDIGKVGLTGKLVRAQIKRVRMRLDDPLPRIFRKPKEADMEKFEQARSREVDTMIRSRKIATDLGLKMKIGDVEYQADGNKAIFYYIADGRVDFRQLIRVLADTFKIRVEMKQIGARQEAGRIGGIGPCGRPMCCASWMTNFVSVATSAARFQDISLNPLGLAGQCAKLKCCLNYEVDTYIEANKQLPKKDVVLETKDKQYYLYKADALSRQVTYSPNRNSPVDSVVISAERAFEVMALNKTGVKPERLSGQDAASAKPEPAFGDILGQDAITRFDKKKKKKKSKSGNQPKGGGQPKEGKPAQEGKQPKQESKKQEPAANRQDGQPKDGNQRRRRGERRGGKQQPAEPKKE